MKLIIKKANIDYASYIAQLDMKEWYAMFSKYLPASALNTLTVSAREEITREFMETKRWEYIIITADHKKIGFAAFGTSHDDTASMEECGEIAAIKLHPAFKKHEIFIRVLEYCTKILLESKKIIHYWVFENDTDTLSFLKYSDFEQSGITKNYIVGKRIFKKILFELEIPEESELTDFDYSDDIFI